MFSDYMQSFVIMSSLGPLIPLAGLSGNVGCVASGRVVDGVPYHLERSVSELQRIVNMDRILNTEYIRF